MDNIRLISCRTHYNKAYLAYAQVAENSNIRNEFGRTPRGFFSHFDKGAGHNPEDNKIWHFFGQLPHEENPGGDTVIALGPKTEWKVLHDGKVRSFSLELTEDDGLATTSLEDLQAMLFKLLEKALSETQSLNDCPPLTAAQFAHALATEQSFFSAWGQGSHKPFDYEEAKSRDVVFVEIDNEGRWKAMLCQYDKMYRHNCEIGARSCLLHNSVTAEEHIDSYGTVTAHHKLSKFWKVESPTADMVFELQTMGFQPVGYIPKEAKDSTRGVAIPL